MHHRIRAAGGNPAILESSAIASLTKLSNGLPRRINALADHALFEAHRAGRVSATSSDVERALQSKGIEIDQKRLQLPDTIKSVGEYPISVKLGSDVTATFKLVVVAAQ